ncbi:ATP phosphoribosyltransferase regulatory subunit [Lachnospiraceae bacterium MD308]|nr:ATP phosphoribosyltransferase regulatory subunit [Lachnospiraceae bacterium MD308]
MKKLLHTPEGVRDIINVQCGRKHALQNRILKIFHQYGYHDIQTPMFEYFDVFRKEIGTVPSRDLYKLFDKEGNTLALRPDITPSVARAAATLFADEELSIRLCYTGNTFINHSSYQGRLREVTQMGVELIGDDAVEADAEMLALVIESLLSVGLKEFQLSVGNVDFFLSLIADANLDEDARERVTSLINNRNYFGVEDYLDKIRVKRSSREAFASLNGLVGGLEVLKEAKEVALSSSGVMAVKRLEKIYDVLKLYGMEQYITFDLSMTGGTYGYYTGIIFRGYTFGTGDAIVKGGRYDRLLEKFGKESPSIGFAIVVDELMNAMNRQKLRSFYARKNTMILYEDGKTGEAVSLAKDLRNKGKNVELLKKDKKRILEEYMEYGKRYYAGSLIYIRENGEITMINLVNGEHKIINGEVV